MMGEALNNLPLKPSNQILIYPDAPPNTLQHANPLRDEAQKLPLKPSATK